MKKHILLLALLSSFIWSFGQSKLVKNLKEGKNQTLVVYGTSITKMGNGPIWVEAVGKELNNLFENKLTLVNAGKSGECSTWALENLDTNVLSHTPDAVIIEFTTNDAVEEKLVSVDQCKTNTETIISRILAVNPDCEIILHTPCGFPIVAADGGASGATPRPDLALYNGVYETICSENNYIWIDEAAKFYQMGTTDIELLKTYAADGVHPTLKGAMGLIYPNVMKSLLTGLSTKDIPAEQPMLFALNCDYFTANSSFEMSAAPTPHNWLSATDRICTSQNIFAQVMTGSNAYLGNCIRFGKSGDSDINCGSLILPKMNLEAPDGKKVMLKISITSGANKSGSLTIRKDGSEMSTIQAKTGNGGNPFGSTYYTFEYEIKDGTALSEISFTHSRTEAAGQMYLNSIQVYLDDAVSPEILNLTCDGFINSQSKDMSELPAPYNWMAVSGMEWTSANTFPQVLSGASAYIGKSIRFGKSSTTTDLTPFNGEALTPKLNLTAPKGKKVIVEVSATSGGDKTGVLTIEVDGTEIGKIAAASGNEGAAFGGRYYNFSFDIPNGSAESQIRFIHTRELNGGFIYVNSIKVSRVDGIITGLTEPVSSGKPVYPNPFSSEIHIGEDVRSVAMFNLQGSRVLESSNPDARVETGELPCGTYILVIKDKSGSVSTHKLVKVN